jgi:uncharacterized protein YkwD
MNWLFLLISLAVNPLPPAELHPQEALNFIAYLNRIRSNPAAYSDSTGVKLNAVKPKTMLNIHPVLMKVAEDKALDMASNNYFDHTNKRKEGINIALHRAGYTIPEYMYQDKKSNSYESIVAGFPNAIDAVNCLIQDKGVHPPGHRNHLLGLVDFWANCTDIGVGYAYREGTEYQWYVCVIIATEK